MRHPGAQTYNAELANIALPMLPNSANEEGKSVKRKKQKQKNETKEIHTSTPQSNRINTFA